MSISNNNLQKYIDSVTFGLTRCLCVNTLLYPLDVIKTHQQASQNHERGYQVVKRIWQQSGPSAFYKGLSAHLLKSSLRQTWSWPMAAGIPQLLTPYNLNPFSTFLITSLSIATVDAAVTTPLEKLRILSITDNKETSLKTLKQQGKAGWHGFDAHWTKLTIRWSAFLNAQAYFREEARKSSNSEQLDYLQLAKIGTKVAFVVSIACAPFDVANTLRQSKGTLTMQTPNWNRQSITANAISGIRNSFKGWPFSATSFIVHNIASVILMEKLGKSFNNK